MSNYIARKYPKKTAVTKQEKQDQMVFGHSTLLSEGVEDIEANQFAFNFLMPAKELKNDFIYQNAKIENLYLAIIIEGK